MSRTEHAGKISSTRQTPDLSWELRSIVRQSPGMSSFPTTTARKETIATGKQKTVEAQPLDQETGCPWGEKLKTHTQNSSDLCETVRLPIPTGLLNAILLHPVEMVPKTGQWYVSGSAVTGFPTEVIILFTHVKQVIRYGDHPHMVTRDRKQTPSDCTAHA